MRTRDLLRFVPGLSRLVRSLDTREHESRLLTEECRRLAAENHRLKAASPRARIRTTSTDELPLPPEVLRLLVAGTDDVEWFLGAGRLAAESLTSLLAKHDVVLDAFARVLDFGCGCGRVLRHLRHLPAELHGCDSNPVAVEWCEEHLPFARVGVNALESPLDHDDETFDVIYALSVFTHLPPHLQSHWTAELRRVLKPGGVLVLSLHGDATTGHLSRGERADYRTGQLVVRGGDLAGTNHCAAFHPPAHVRSAFARGFEVLEHVPEGAKGNPPQDAWVLKKLT
jgi:SAM-dependent methyltransferase